MVYPVPGPVPEPKFWYDCIVAPFETIVTVFEQVDARGWDVVQTFNTGMTVNVKQSIMLPGMAPQVSSLIAVVCRIKRVGKERRFVFPEMKAAQGNILDGKFPPASDN